MQDAVARGEPDRARDAGVRAADLALDREGLLLHPRRPDEERRALAGREEPLGLEPWTSATFRVEGRTFRITAVPARHGPDGTEHLTGPVTGFVLASEGLPTVYVSGDNASVELVREVAARFRVDVAVLFAGAARSPKLLGDALLTLDAARAVEAARALAGAVVVPVHFRGWGHFTDDPGALRVAFDAAGLFDRLVLLDPGASVTLPR
ncbi:MAG: MBL fold metallo-hydrolase [Anaeromyxobacter sp.]